MLKALGSKRSVIDVVCSKVPQTFARFTFLVTPNVAGGMQSEWDQMLEWAADEGDVPRWTGKAVWQTCDAAVESVHISSAAPVARLLFGLVSLLGSLPGSLVPLVFEGMVLLVGLVLRSAMLMLVSGRILLVKLCSFLSSQHGPSSVSDLGVGGVSFVELLILFERSVPKPRRFDRPISGSAVPAGPSIDIWRSCRFLGRITCWSR